MIDSALAYAARGYEVLPLRGKTPLTGQGFYDATTDAQVIEYWWDKWPDANIGCRPPEPAIIFDVDPRNGGSLAALGDYPETRTARTGSGGWHVWFGARGKFRSTLLGADGIDIKTQHGLIAMPPSIHPTTGRPYVWEIGNPVAALPEHLISRVVKPPRRRSPAFTGKGKMTDTQLAGIIRTMEDATVDRNNTLLWCACRLFEHDAGPDAFIQLEMAASYTGLGDDEITRTIESAAKQVA
ncbi:hypothetical protein ACT18_04570 [Mycolicibacter kumamotonensis]|uniref:DNA primase/polymerase bifunctional N-terminal domain-containing protein n=1 Tax=Mycolicibacter kumamotonensis TaxID=354243 RepID=A0A1B8SK90_9MYCO|nr:hypothetical protein ACT18_04570 [Mycolicibacter kumamotonensis]